MQNKFMNGILAAAVAVALGACSATAPVADKAQSAAVQAEVEQLRVLPLEGGRNFRDLGGYETTDGKTVKWGKMYRSGILTNLTANDYDYLRDRNIATIVDFRSTKERTQEPDNWRGSNAITLEWDYDMNWEKDFARVFAKPDFSKQDLVALMDKGYIDLVKQQTPAYRAMFQKLIENDEPLLFHCTAGKDRTGIGAALILTALGVDRETVKQDYMLSNKTLAGVKMMELPEDANEKEKRMYAFMAQLPEDIRGVMSGVELSWLESAFEEMEREHGSVEGYIEHALDVDAQELALLKARYLQ
ncbi:tyrosine-protein phosphatase [Microbulbifer bruguierae]|uniref:Tyrosine-protein phosphatase n=1 Tax=Microbulbifer bruguierae TaxID=3029061 RepID=A0ABY8NB32_9GAMM|nr:tyrosine-protein phosphatase [Microbulbifer bruguierae]WGL16140.1 tyrosine-protein phosphatase [Microbulbifer bruguierae]